MSQKSTNPTAVIPPANDPTESLNAGDARPGSCTRFPCHHAYRGTAHTPDVGGTIKHSSTADRDHENDAWSVASTAIGGVEDGTEWSTELRVGESSIVLSADEALKVSQALATAAVRALQADRREDGEERSS